MGEEDIRGHSKSTHLMVISNYINGKHATTLSYGYERLSLDVSVSHMQKQNPGNRHSSCITLLGSGR